MTPLQQCSQKDKCRNSLLNTNNAQQKCSICRLAPNNEDFDQHFWSGIKGAKHPQLELEKKKERAVNLLAKQIHRKTRSKPKQRLLKKAVKAEKTTEKNIIASTENSGRVHRDGDHNLHGFVSLDTKLQSERVHPIVKLDELDKIALDCKRGGNTLGGLVIRNKYDVGIVVMKEEDFAILVAEVQRKANGNTEG